MSVASPQAMNRLSVGSLLDVRVQRLIHGLSERVRWVERADYRTTPSSTSTDLARTALVACHSVGLRTFRAVDHEHFGGVPLRLESHAKLLPQSRHERK